MSERQTAWLRTRSIDGGWVVRCDLCGKDFRRTFMAANTNHAEAYRAAVAYGSMHEKSDEHAAALSAFHAEDISESKASREETLLREIFGGPARTELDLRREAAKRAALKVKRTAASRS